MNDLEVKRKEIELEEEASQDERKRRNNVHIQVVKIRTEEGVETKIKALAVSEAIVATVREERNKGRGVGVRKGIEVEVTRGREVGVIGSREVGARKDKNLPEKLLKKNLINIALKRERKV